MDDNIDEFRTIYGDEMVEYLQMKICEDGLVEEFEKVKKDPRLLLTFGIKYGFYSIVEYWYVYKGIAYDLNTITNYIQCITSDTNDNFVQAESSGGVRTGITLMKMDKYMEARNLCINFLLSLKKYSTCTSKNRNHVYRFNPKYHKVLFG